MKATALILALALTAAVGATTVAHHDEVKPDAVFCAEVTTLVNEWLETHDPDDPAPQNDIHWYDGEINYAGELNRLATTQDQYLFEKVVARSFSQRHNLAMYLEWANNPPENDTWGHWDWAMAESQLHINITADYLWPRVQHVCDMEVPQ